MSKPKKQARKKHVKAPSPHDAWVALVRERFAFLEAAGFVPAPPAVAFPQITVWFERGSMNVTFASEYYEPPNVFVTNREPYASFTLREAIELLEPAYAAERPQTPASAISLDDLAAWLDYYAAFVRRQPSLFESHARIAARVLERRQSSSSS